MQCDYEKSKTAEEASSTSLRDHCPRDGRLNPRPGGQMTWHFYEHLSAFSYAGNETLLTLSQQNIDFLYVSFLRLNHYPCSNRFSS